MNYRMIWQALGRVVGVEALLMGLPLLVALIYGEPVRGLLSAMFVAIIIALLLCSIKPKSGLLFAKEGFVIVSLSWMLMSLIGALPFVIDGAIESYVDAVFEVVSGFTTTGASILTDVEAMGYGLLFWRSFTHWIGGMGVLVFVMAILPMSGDRSMHIMRAEVPGPVVGKLAPRMRSTASILYLIYIFLTAAEVVSLLLGDMPLFDALIHAFGTAGTGGFSSKLLSVGHYNSAYIDAVIGTFMILFGINFNLYFFILLGKIRAVWKSEELRWYLGIILFAVLTIAANIFHLYGNIADSLRYSYFQVASIITTTGFATANFDLWPEYSRSLLVLIMFIGACAGSTGGGIKVSRFIILIKSSLCEVKRMLHPRSVNIVKVDDVRIESATVHSTLVFFMLYILIAMVTMLIVSIDGFDFTTTVTGSIACISNIGPGLSLVGPNGSYAMFSDLSKIVLSFAMLFGRLEIFPIILLFAPTTWKST